MTAISEAYGRAVNSSHLECDTGLGDIQVLIAAGKVHDGLGVKLLRLRIERDSISQLPGAELMHTRLRSYAGAHAGMLLMLQSEAGRQSLEASDAELRVVVTNALDLFLDPMCHPCGGTGRIGPYGSRQGMCPGCKGSTKRKLFWGEQIAFKEAAGFLAVQIEDRMGVALRKISRARKELAEALAAA